MVAGGFERLPSNAGVFSPTGHLQVRFHDVCGDSFGRPCTNQAIKPCCLWLLTLRNRLLITCAGLQLGCLPGCDTVRVLALHLTCSSHEVQDKSGCWQASATWQSTQQG